MIAQRTELKVVDLRTGSARFYPAGTFRGDYDDASGCAPYGRDTTDIALRIDGAIAFITEDGEVARSTPQPGNRLVTLDRGPNVLRDSLRLTSSGLTWVSDGQRRTARLPAHCLPADCCSRPDSERHRFCLEAEAEGATRA